MGVLDTLEPSDFTDHPGSIFRGPLHISQTSNWSGTFFCCFLQQTGSRLHLYRYNWSLTTATTEVVINNYMTLLAWLSEKKNSSIKFEKLVNIDFRMSTGAAVDVPAQC